jgi:hypothetical protein
LFIEFGIILLKEKRKKLDFGNNSQVTRNLQVNFGLQLIAISNITIITSKVQSGNKDEDVLTKVDCYAANEKKLLR